ncbi:MAG: hypothetical protein ACJ72Z_07620 [Pyrinomonadaceae bacterium]
MRSFVKALLIPSFILVLGSISTFGQTPGMRVDAEIPFDFTVGKATFSEGKYKLILTRLHDSLYSVSMFGTDGKRVLSTTAIRNGSTNRKNSDMVFAISDGGHYLDKLRTADAGFKFIVHPGERIVAESKRTSVPVSGAPNF